MSTLPTLPGRPNLEGGLHTRRCVRHEVREAAARCPGCSRDFCRECVVDHAGKLLCAACVAKRAAAPVAPRGSRGAALRRMAGLAAAVAMAWAAFFIVGKILLAIPPAVHEGTIWKTPAEAAR